MYNAEKNLQVSVIIPVKNGNKTLGACLRSIKRSYFKNIEILVVDDHSTDNSVEIAESYNCKVLQSSEGDGANRARNFGAKNAKGEILIFLDSDVEVRSDTIQTIVETLETGNVDAVVGVYSAQHRNENIVSQYKNLWIRFSYLKSPPAIDWLFGAVSGIKRDAFEKIGGFNVELLAHKGHDDIELGKRFAQANLNIALNVDVEVEHLKHYTLCSFIKNEFHRSSGFAELATKLGETTQSLKHGFVNVYPVFIISTIFTVVLIGILLLSIFGKISYWFLAGGFGLYLIANIRFLNYLEQARGLFAMLVMIPILFLDHIVCFVGSVIGVIKSFVKIHTKR
ncbi:MAG: glycosyltransferase family 2 protein [Bacteroidota bacterium]|nr:glycosyltransferase family 2 protein [Bacteroidota bacterium]